MEKILQKNGTNNKDSKDELFGENSNRLTRKQFEKLKADIEEKFPGVKLEADEEYVHVVREDGGKLELLRWQKFAFAPNGHIEGERTIEEEIERFIKNNR